MSKNAMAGAVTLCGVGLCLIGGALMMQSGAQAHAAGLPTAIAAAIGSATVAQTEPTVVWYGTAAHNYSSEVFVFIVRAWSDGRIEMRRVRGASYYDPCTAASTCVSPWVTVNDPSEGYRAMSDSNADELVDGADLTALLSNWGDAPRVPFPPSDCPLNLINP